MTEAIVRTLSAAGLCLLLWGCVASETELKAVEGIDSLVVWGVAYHIDRSVAYTPQSVIRNAEERGVIVDKDLMQVIKSRTDSICIGGAYGVDARLVCVIYRNGYSDTLAFGGVVMWHNGRGCPIDTALLYGLASAMSESYRQNVVRYVGGIWWEGREE